MVGYKTASAHEFLAVTGARVDGVKICKKAMLWPLQRVGQSMPHRNSKHTNFHVVYEIQHPA